jgi:chromosomal replication initiation ATPase DnaA
MRSASLDRHPWLDPSVARHVRKFIRNVRSEVDAGKGLWFHGDIGTGKTTLALLVARAAQEVGCSVAIYSVPLLLAELRETFEAESKDSFLTLFRRLATVDLLVLDDLGAERETDWVLEQLFSLINERWQDERSIVVTSNAPDSSQGGTLTTLREAIARLDAETNKGAHPEALTPIVAELKAVEHSLSELEFVSNSDPLTLMRERLGARTVSRLYDICDDPLILSGVDLRMRMPGA